MLKRGTWLLLMSAIALAGGVLFFENRTSDRSSDLSGTSSERTAEAADTEQLFPFEEEAIEQFSVQRTVEGDNEEKEKLSFVKGEDGNWTMTQPEATVAENGAIAFLLSQVTTTNARPVTPETEPNSTAADILEPFGLAEPIATISMSANGSAYLLHIGGPDFAGDQRYVQAISQAPNQDTSNQESDDTDDAEPTTDAAVNSAPKLYLVSGSIITAVDRPTEEWLLADEQAGE